MRKSTQQIMWPGLAIVCLCVWWVDFNRPVAPEQVRQVGVDIFSDNHEVQPLKAYATSTGQPDSIWIRAESPTPGDILYVWDTGTGEGDLWGFNRKMELERLEGGSANVDTTTGALTAKFLEQHPESIDQAIWPYDQNRQTSPPQHPVVPVRQHQLPARRPKTLDRPDDGAVLRRRPLRPAVEARISIAVGRARRGLNVIAWRIEPS